MNAPPELSTERSNPTTKEMLLLLLGLLLFLAYFVLYFLIPKGAFEFSYSPVFLSPVLYSPMRGFTYEQGLGHIWRILLATPALLLIVYGVRGSIKVPHFSEKHWFQLAWIVSFFSLAYATWLMFAFFANQPICLDEQTYVEQAKMLLNGQFANPNLPVCPELAFMVKSKIGCTGKYLLGEPAVLALGMALGFNTLLHLPLAALTLVFSYRAVKLSTASVTLSSWTVILLALSPMFVFFIPTSLSQTTSLFCMSLAFLGFAMLYRNLSIWGAVWLAVGIGFGMHVRPQAAFPVGVVLASACLVFLYQKRAWKPMCSLLFGLSLWAFGLLAYNYILTGHPFKLPWFLGISDHYGFSLVWPENSIYKHTVWKGIENLFVVMVRWNAWWLGWPSSILLLLAWLVWKRPRAGARLMMWCAFAILVFEFGYYSTGISDLGPAYHFELLLPAAFLGAHTIAYGIKHHRKLTFAALMVNFIFGTSTFVIFQQQRLGRLLHQIHHESDQVYAKLGKEKKKVILFFEETCSERYYFGWIDSGFPKRSFSDQAKIVTYPRPVYKEVGKYLKRYPNRVCWHFRNNPQTGNPELNRCEDVIHLFKRPLETSEKCLWIPPTAARLGWFDPFKLRDSYEK